MISPVSHFLQTVGDTFFCMKTAFVFTLHKELFQKNCHKLKLQGSNLPSKLEKSLKSVQYKRNCG